MLSMPKKTILSISCLVLLTNVCFAQTAGDSAKTVKPAVADTAKKNVTAETATAKPDAASSMTAEGMCFTTSVTDKNPTDTLTAGKEGAVTCWAFLKNATAPAKITFVWYKDDKIVFESPLTVQFRSGRYWSTKNVSKGNWKVEIIDEAKTVIGTSSLTVE